MNHTLHTQQEMVYAVGGVRWSHGFAGQKNQNRSITWLQPVERTLFIRSPEQIVLVNRNISLVGKQSSTNNTEKESAQSAKTGIRTKQKAKCYLNRPRSRARDNGCFLDVFQGSSWMRSAYSPQLRWFFRIARFLRMNLLTNLKNFSNCHRLQWQVHI
jgi:hypothetical protein